MKQIPKGFIYYPLLKEEELKKLAAKHGVEYCPPKPPPEEKN